MEEFQTHMDFTNGYRVKHPGDWQKQTITPTVTGFFAPLENPADIFSENVNIGVEDAPVTLDEYVDFQVAQMDAAGGNLQLSHRSNTHLAGLPAQKIEFHGQLGPLMRRGRMEMVPMRWMQVYVLKNRRVYCVTYTAEPQSFDRYMPKVRKMLDSLELS